ncbi:MAG: hypothetical protein CL847_02085 [Crocinitomicaceae bacterium]|nr:hypothetical protein [Crocinitomicaceae bacterium]|tara:strand:- start:15429 stop:17615 length:2187 start_codon:yes stop_codon:yes gene_type:complete
MKRLKHILLFSTLSIASSVTAQQVTVATHWNEEILEGIRNDFARPTVHARNLLHSSIIMYDAWAAYDTTSSETYFLGKSLYGYTCDFDEDNFSIPESQEEVKEAQEIAMSYAVYRLMKHRYGNSPQADATMSNINARMMEMELDTLVESTDYINDGPSALGNYLAEQMIEYGMQDGSNEIDDYANICYESVNPNILPEIPGTNGIIDPNAWQAVELSFAIDQSGELLTSTPPFLGPEWGNVNGFALRDSNMTALEKDGCIYNIYHNPGPPVYIDTTNPSGFEESPYKWGFGMVVNWSQHLDPYDGVMWDIGPSSLRYDGNIPEFEDFPEFYDWERGGLVAWYNEDGSFGGNGHDINPFTGVPYEPNIVPRGDYGRVIAEFWADGPDSETPPGHWFTLLNEFILVGNYGNNRWRGQGPIIDDLEFAVKSYLALGGAMHDCAISAWSSKGYYDYIRPVSAVRFMAENGQSSDPNLPSYHPAGLPLKEGLVKLIDDDSPLAFFGGVDQVGKVSVKSWKGPDYIEVPMIDEAGVDWILADQWWPYQRPSFVTPPFAAYVSGHSTFSRAAAELFELLTGSPYWPGGLAEWPVPMNEFLVFEDGPSVTFNLQWATFMDASNESALSRIWGGIHPPIDDAPGRKIGKKVGKYAFNFAETIVFPDWAMEFGGDGFLPNGDCPGDFDADSSIGISDFLMFLSSFGLDWSGPYDLDNNEEIGVSDLLQMLMLFGTDCN